MMRPLAMCCLVLSAMSCAGGASGGSPATRVPTWQGNLEHLMYCYTEAFETANAELMESLFWSDDVDFVEIEDHIPMPFGEETFGSLMDWFRKNQKPGGKMVFRDILYYLLSPDVATSVSIQEIGEGDDKSVNRVLLVYLKKDGEWRIIQGHFSAMPE